MYDFGKIRFIQEYEDSTVEHNIRGDASLDEVVEAFEMFLKGAGYHLRDGQHIGYEYDGDYDYKDPDKVSSDRDTFTVDMFESVDDYLLR